MGLKRTLSQVVRYGLTGGAAAVVDLGLFSALCPAVLPVAPAATVSFLCAAVVNYVLTAKFVFKATFVAGEFLKVFRFRDCGSCLQRDCHRSDRQSDPGTPSGRESDRHRDHVPIQFLAERGFCLRPATLNRVTRRAIRRSCRPREIGMRASQRTLKSKWPDRHRSDILVRRNSRKGEMRSRCPLLDDQLIRDPSLILRRYSRFFLIHQQNLTKACGEHWNDFGVAAKLDEIVYEKQNDQWRRRCDEDPAS